MNTREESSLRKLAECRICHDEDVDSNMETPCFCSGTLKYAHRRCVERWCNEKENAICEICHQQFRPNYTASLLVQLGCVPMNFRGNLEISRRDIDSSHLMEMVSTEDDRIQYDEDLATDTRTLVCCQGVALTFMALLILRQTFPLLISGWIELSFPLSLLLLLRTVGIILPIYVIVRVITAIKRRRLYQEPSRSIYSPNEVDHIAMQPEPHVIHVITVQGDDDPE